MTNETKSANQSAPFVAKPVKFVHRNEAAMPMFHADGGWGISSHHNLIRINFYAENPPCPTSVIQEVNPDSSPLGDQKQIGIDDPEYYIINRDFQCAVVLTLMSAVQVHQMLGNFIKVVQQQMRDQALEFQQMKEAAEKKSAQQAK